MTDREVDCPGLQTWKRREKSIWPDMEAMGKTCILHTARYNDWDSRAETSRQQRGGER